jgi:hypothetical protein
MKMQQPKKWTTKLKKELPVYRLKQNLKADAAGVKDKKVPVGQQNAAYPAAGLHQVVADKISFLLRLEILIV